MCDFSRVSAWFCDEKISLKKVVSTFTSGGTMSVIGPRPQLVRDMVFMTDEQRMRHTAKPGLSGLAQVNGRNAISWEDKIDWDLKYIEKVSLKEDLKITFVIVCSDTWIQADTVDDFLCI